MNYFIVGTGRSGTSTIARILHKQFNVFMGKRFRLADDANPGGYWEDLDFKGLNQQVIAGQISLPVWMVKIERLIAARNREHGLWGLKDPRLCYLLGFYLSVADNASIIRCNRPVDLVVPSLIKHYGWSEREAKHTYRDRNARLDRILAGRKHTVIEFTKPIENMEVTKWLKQALYPSR